MRPEIWEKIFSNFFPVFSPRYQIKLPTTYNFRNCAQYEGYEKIVLMLYIINTTINGFTLVFRKIFLEKSTLACNVCVHLGLPGYIARKILQKSGDPVLRLTSEISERAASIFSLESSCIF